ncbi:CLUMA_CG016046, isoform A [Clunio marinus]|uniref:CLUMA_CG016046, isoform A n=1 Tax=Clunio marinus TaxID=568069 RepID=A0A1J1IRD6_9DIPT|nr:CLUMA_CG016046, isoform A [Clunio marinus]
MTSFSYTIPQPYSKRKETESLMGSEGFAFSKMLKNHSILNLLAIKMKPQHRELWNFNFAGISRNDFTSLLHSLKLHLSSSSLNNIPKMKTRHNEKKEKRQLVVKYFPQFLARDEKNRTRSQREKKKKSQKT